MKITDVKVGDEVFCIESYVDTEIVYSLRKFADDDKMLVHLQHGKKYKVENVSSGDQLILVKNDFDESYWYDISRFAKIKEIRKQKLIRLKNGFTK